MMDTKRTPQLSYVETVSWDVCRLGCKIGLDRILLKECGHIFFHRGVLFEAGSKGHLQGSLVVVGVPCLHFPPDFANEPPAFCICIDTHWSYKSSLHYFLHRQTASELHDVKNWNRMNEKRTVR